MAMIRSGAGAAMAVLAVLAMVLEAHAQCPSATSFISCQAAVTSMTPPEPTVACCNKVQAVLAQTDGAQCLCGAMTSSTAVTFKVIKEKAILLPSRCAKLMGLKYIKGYNCKGLIVP